MTPEEWDRCTNPAPMLEFLRGRASDRKLRLFACACHRRIWHLLGDDGDLRKAVDLIERCADDLVGEQERGAVDQAEQALIGPADRGWESIPWVERAAQLAIDLATWKERQAWEDAQVATFRSRSADPPAPATQHWAEAAFRQAVTAERGGQYPLLRDVFGPLPFRPVSIDPAWLAWHGGAIKALAQSLYEERELPSGHLDAARLGVLADMLEEAGCCDAELLGHLRGPGPHVRGCFAVDLLLGKV
jgi:hypothetical protein